MDNRDAHGFLRACYLDEELPLAVRKDAAKAALPYEKPKLEAVAIKHYEGDWGDRLDRANARVAGLRAARAKGIEAVVEFIRGPKVIEGEAVEIKEPDLVA